jgi:hypothetical protein
MYLPQILLWLTPLSSSKLCSNITVTMKPILTIMFKITTYNASLHSLVALYSVFSFNTSYTLCNLLLHFCLIVCLTQSDHKAQKTTIFLFFCSLL